MNFFRLVNYDFPDSQESMTRFGGGGNGSLHRRMINSPGHHRSRKYDRSRPISSPMKLKHNIVPNDNLDVEKIQSNCTIVGSQENIRLPEKARPVKCTCQHEKQREERQMKSGQFPFLFKKCQLFN